MQREARVGKPISYGNRGRINRSIHRAPFHLKAGRSAPVPSHRQYVVVSFGGGKPYTYHNDGEPLAVGDRVIVSTLNGSRVVDVVNLLDKPPPFTTQACRKAPPRKSEGEEARDDRAN